MKLQRFLFALFLPALLTLAGCQHTREAYNAADEPADYAYVLAEHYSSLLHQAVELKRKPTTPREAVAIMQRVELKATPAVKQLKDLRIAYLKVQDATTEAQLQAAIDDAVLLIADMVRAIRDARGGGSTSLLDQRIILHAQLLEAS